MDMVSAVVYFIYTAYSIAVVIDFLVGQESQACTSFLLLLGSTVYLGKSALEPGNRGAEEV